MKNQYYEIKSIDDNSKKSTWRRFVMNIPIGKRYYRSCMRHISEKLNDYRFK